MAWGSDTVPADWSEAQIDPVHKKRSGTQHSEGGKGELSGWVQLEGSKVQFLLFVDDPVLVAENEEDTKKNA